MMTYLVSVKSSNGRHGRSELRRKPGGFASCSGAAPEVCRGHCLFARRRLWIDRLLRPDRRAQTLTLLTLACRVAGKGIKVIVGVEGGGVLIGGRFRLGDRELGGGTFIVQKSRLFVLST